MGKRKCITGQQIRDSIEPHNIDIGCSASILSNNLPLLLKYTHSSWITHTWEFLCEKYGSGGKYSKPATSMPQRHFTNGRIYEKRHTRGRNRQTEHIPDLPTCHLPIRPCPQGTGNQFTLRSGTENQSSWNLNTNGLHNRDPTKDPGKFEISPPYYLQPLSLSRSRWDFNFHSYVLMIYVRLY